MKRSAGILLPVFSLPGPYGIGTLGKEARSFADFLKAAGQRWWQILPVGPTGAGDSPYTSVSTFAGNPLLLDPEALAAEGLLTSDDLEKAKVPEGPIDYAALYESRETLLRTASAADLLILDDLGTEFVTPYFITTFYSLLNNRLGAGLPTIVTTNIADGSLLEKRYTEKISSRLSSFVPCLFAGEDIRGLKAAE